MDAHCTNKNIIFAFTKLPRLFSTAFFFHRVQLAWLIPWKCVSLTLFRCKMNARWKTWTNVIPFGIAWMFHTNIKKNWKYSCQRQLQATRVIHKTDKVQNVFPFSQKTSLQKCIYDDDQHVITFSIAIFTFCQFESNRWIWVFGFWMCTCTTPSWLWLHHTTFFTFKSHECKISLNGNSLRRQLRHDQLYWGYCCSLQCKVHGSEAKGCEKLHVEYTGSTHFKFMEDNANIQRVDEHVIKVNCMKYTANEYLLDLEIKTNWRNNSFVHWCNDAACNGLQ